MLSSPDLKREDRALALAAGVVTLVIAGSGFLDWHAPGWIPMKLTTAAALALGGASLILAALSQRARALQVGLALVMAAAGVLFMIEGTLGLDFGVDNLIAPGADAMILGRPPVAAARGMIVTGVALALLSAPGDAARLIRLSLAIIGLVGALVTTLGALMTPADASLHVQLFPVAVLAPVGFACLSVGVLASGPPGLGAKGFVKFGGPVIALVALLTSASLSLVSIEAQQRARPRAIRRASWETPWRACSICCRTPRRDSAAIF